MQFATELRERIRHGRIRCCVLAAAVCVIAAIPRAADGQGSQPILFDRHMSVAAGATAITTTGAVVADVENAFIPHRLFEERGISRRAANVTYRFARWVWFDVPQESFLVVLNHEVFGHGGRLRESFDGAIGYHFDAPAPYGKGGGTTYFEFSREPSETELLAVTTGGMEASAAAASLIATRAVRSGAIDVREAIRYLGFELDSFSYIEGTGDAPEKPGHDVSDFLETYNDIAKPLGAALTARTVRHEAWVSLANPMLVYALAGVARYIWDGTPSSSVPAVRIGNARYLPLARYRLTPFGTEFVISNEIATPDNASTIDLRLGRAPGVTPWGVTVQRQQVVELRAWKIGLTAHAWRQPSAVGTTDHLSRQMLSFGAAVMARGERPLRGVSMFGRPLSLLVEGGFKSAGFIAGEALDRGVVVRAGSAIAVRR